MKEMKAMKTTREAIPACKLLFSKSIFIAACYLAMTVLAMIGVHFSIQAGIFPRDGRQASSVLAFISYGGLVSVPMFVTILQSITLGMYFEPLLLMGVSRRNCFAGVLCSSCLLSLCLCGAFALAGFLFGVYDAGEAAFGLLSASVLCLAYCTAGWTVTVGFLLRRVYTAAPGLLAGMLMIAATWFVSSGAFGPFGEIAVARMSGADSVLLLFLSTAAVQPILFAAVRRVPAKC
jgi:hypothetical protein